MRTAVIIGVTALLAVICILWFLSNQPSEEMLALERIESELSLPEAPRRTVYDKGCYKDWKDVKQYDRRIHYSLSEDQPVPELVDRIMNDENWSLTHEEFNVMGTTTWFTKNTDDACLYVSQDREIVYTVKGVPHPYTIILDDCKNRDFCSRY